MTAECCRYLEWDSAFFGLRIARVADDPTPEQAQAAASWCEANRIDCLYCLTNAPLQASGFHLVDVRVTLTRALPADAAQTPAVRLFEPGDSLRLREIARVSFGHSRFYQDGNFPRERCGAL